MDEFTFDELFFEGIPDAGYDEFASMCKDTGNDTNITVSDSGRAEKAEGFRGGAQEMSLLSEDEKQMLQSIPNLCKKVEDLRMDNRDSIAEMNTMRRFLERLNIWIGQIHALLQSIENRLAQGAGQEKMGLRADGSTHCEVVDKA